MNTADRRTRRVHIDRPPMPTRMATNAVPLAELPGNGAVLGRTELRARPWQEQPGHRSVGLRFQSRLSRCWPSPHLTLAAARRVATTPRGPPPVGATLPSSH